MTCSSACVGDGGGGDLVWLQKFLFQGAPLKQKASCFRTRLEAEAHRLQYGLGTLCKGRNRQLAATCTFSAARKALQEYL